MKKRILLAVIAAVLVAAAVLICLVLTGVIGSEQREIIWTNMGDGGKIPCVGIADAQYAVTEDFRYVFRKANDPELDAEWGTVMKIVNDEAKPIVNKHYGDDVYLTRYVNTTLETYQQLLEDMQYAGFTVYAQSQLNGDVHTASLTYETYTYTVTHFARTGVTNVTATDKVGLSPYLKPENESTQSQQTCSSSMQIFAPRGTGAGFVIQLKNGNFVIVDGGNIWNMEKLLSYLEENTPEGQIPVVEAWFVTYGDYDRSGWTAGFIGSESDLKYTPELYEPVPAAQRLIVNGVYYNTPAPDAISAASFKEAGTVDGTTYYKKNVSSWIGRVKEGAGKLKTQTGEKTPVYRPTAGQVYHFSGVTVEVTWSPEMIEASEYNFDLKTSVSCLVIRAEGKAVLDLSSAVKTVQDRIVQTYTDTYWRDLDVMLAPHHGRRLFEVYKDVFKAPLICIETNDPAALGEESAAVAQGYAQDPQIRCYWYTDGDLHYNFATGEYIVTPIEEKKE